MKKSTLALVAALAVIIIGFFIYLFAGTHNGDVQLPILGNPGHTVGPFSFVDQAGDTVTQKDLNNRVTVVDFFYTTCPGICPRMNRNMDKLYETFKNDSSFQILSNTVDPDHDSVPVLEKYSEQYGASPGIWKFLTGKKSELYHVAVQQYLLSAADSTGVTSTFVHTQYFALVDQQRQIRGFYDGLKKGDLSKLRRDIRILLRHPD